MSENATPDPSAFLLIFTAFPDAAQAREVARVLVREQLAACASLLPGVMSFYVWQGTHHESEEVLALFKTRREVYPALETRLQAIHPYEVPEIVAVDLAAGLPAYLEWVSTGVAKRQGASPRQS